MLVKYYKDERLSYASRNRYSILPELEYTEENQRSILLGDGAYTTIKTDKSNLCNYVVIDNTRWFVASYRYLNGSQIELSLQRDVIGEFGISSFFGKINRGITDNILKNKKELSLNQILKKRNDDFKSRIPLIPDSNKYGEYSVDNHLNECWGIMYLTKPTDGEPSININIPSFKYDISGLPLLDVGKRTISSNAVLAFSGTFCLAYDWYEENIPTKFYFYIVKLRFNADLSGNISYANSSIYFKSKYTSSYKKDMEKNSCSALIINSSAYFDDKSDEGYNTMSIKILNAYINKVLSKSFINENVFNPGSVQVASSVLTYNNKYVGDNEDIYIYNVDELTERVPEQGNSIGSSSDIKNALHGYDFGGSGFSSIAVNPTQYNGLYIDPIDPTASSVVYCYRDNVVQNVSRKKIVDYVPDELVLDVSVNLIDEPYILYAVPLYDVNIYRDNELKYSVFRNNAFSSFNKIIQYLSGTNGYLVDAQIYPYCPDLNREPQEINGVPIFQVDTNSFTRRCSVDARPFEDVKKEYICRERAIVSPDHSNKFSFNFYDYKTSNSVLEVDIKTALKPFSIISSAVIVRDENSLMGIRYPSDLSGCQPTSNGFEVSLATNQFQEYIRNNSNFEKTFNKNQEYLSKQHEIERSNESVQAVVNTLSASMMGAIGGAAMTGGGIPGIAGAVAGGTVAGVTVGTAMAAQSAINENMRNYEYNLQKELFDLNIGQVKNLPNSISRISSFNEIILREFWFMFETYECTDEEIELVNLFLEKYSYDLGVYGWFVNYFKSGRFIKGSIITSNLITNLHNIANKEMQGGVYFYVD